MACAAALLLWAPVSLAEGKSRTDRHDAGFTSADLLERPERDQRIWLGAAATGLANGVGLSDTEAGRCIMDWYFAEGDQAYTDMRANMQSFPEHSPTTIMIALARRACPEAEILR